MQMYPTMSSLRKLLDPETMTRQELYFSRDYSVEGYEPMPSSRVLMDPAYNFPRTGSLGYIPDDWRISHMQPLEVLESGWKEAEAAKTLIPWLLKHATSCTRAAALYPPPPSSSHLAVPLQQPSLRLALRDARARGGAAVVMEAGDYRPTRRLVVRSPKALLAAPQLPVLSIAARQEEGDKDEGGGSRGKEVVCRGEDVVEQMAQEGEGATTLRGCLPATVGPFVDRERSQQDVSGEGTAPEAGIQLAHDDVRLLAEPVAGSVAGCGTGQRLAGKGGGEVKLLGGPGQVRIWSQWELSGVSRGLMQGLAAIYQASPVMCL